MNSKHIGADLNYAWPNAEIAVMGARGAAEIIFRKDITAAADPENRLKEKEEAYSTIFSNTWRAAARGFIDEVILPPESRARLIRSEERREGEDRVSAGR